MSIIKLIDAAYERLYDNCGSDDERLLVNALYKQLDVTNTQQVAFFLSLRNQIEVIPNRRFRLDFAAVFEGKKYALEFEGGCYSRGIASVGYRSIGGYKKHVAKYNVLAANGWLVFRFQNDSQQLQAVWDVLGLKNDII